jgi:hypothetical protein
MADRAELERRLEETERLLNLIKQRAELLNKLADDLQKQKDAEAEEAFRSLRSTGSGRSFREDEVFSLSPLDRNQSSLGNNGFDTDALLPFLRRIVECEHR